ncbi:MAG TPA: DUF58 domain-containing protein [Actinomycetota bacterium]|nr:DUF58 domain-containing protein [Actinomycetota bacterium]
MPTARGWFTAATGVTLWVVGRSFGTGVLEQIGFGILALVAIAAVVVTLRRDDLRVERTIVPARARAGQAVAVELHLRNVARRALPLLLLDDRLPLDLAGHARFALSGVEAGGARTATYEVRPPRRGRFLIGPLGVSYLDPFGLAGTTTLLTDTDELLVHPRIERLTLPRDLGSQRSISMSALRQLSGARGEDFYTMREYSQGDDLRRIHWPSTAKRGKPMIRQEETPWHTRATILLDDRARPGEAFKESVAFERAVEAAASFCDLYHRSGYTYRLVGAHHPGVASGRGTDHFQRCLDALATLSPTDEARAGDALLARLAELELGAGAEGTLVVVSTDLSPDAAGAVSRCLRRFGAAVALLYPLHRFGAGAGKSRWEGEARVRDAVTALGRSGVPTLVLGAGQSLAAAWGAVASGSARAPQGGEAWDRKHEPA